MNWKIMTMTFIELYTVYVKTLGQFFVHTYVLTSLNKDTSVLVKVINIWTSSLVKYQRNTMYIRINPSIKLQNRRTRKIHTMGCLMVFMRAFTTHVLKISWKDLKYQSLQSKCHKQLKLENVELIIIEEYLLIMVVMVFWK